MPERSQIQGFGDYTAATIIMGGFGWVLAEETFATTPPPADVVARHDWLTGQIDSLEDDAHYYAKAQQSLGELHQSNPVTLASLAADRQRAQDQMQSFTAEAKSLPAEHTDPGLVAIAVCAGVLAGAGFVKLRNWGISKLETRAKLRLQNDS